MESSPMLCKQGVTGSIPVTSTNIPGPPEKPVFIPRLQSTLYLDNI
jgi:hypothetical protein